MEEFAARIAGPPDRDFRRAGSLRLVDLPDQRRENMRGAQVEIVVWAVEVCRHRGDKIVSVFRCIGLAKPDACDFSQRVGVVRGFERACEKRVLRDRLRCQLRVNAGTAKKEEFAHAVVGRRADHVVLDRQILDKKLDRLLGVRHDPAHARGRIHDDLRALGVKESPHGPRVEEVEFGPRPQEQMMKALLLQTPDNPASHHPPVPGHEYFCVLVHNQGPKYRGRDAQMKAWLQAGRHPGNRPVAQSSRNFSADARLDCR